MSVDLERKKRETLRWVLIQTLDSARPIGANEQLVLEVCRELQPDVTQLQIRRELAYLEEREVVQIERRHGTWHARLTRCGIDIAEYTVDVEPGIARPDKYW